MPFAKAFLRDGFFIRAPYDFPANIKLIYRPKILILTLFVFILLAGLIAGIFLSSLASVHAAPQQTVMAGDVVISEFRTTSPKGGNDEFIELFNRTGGNIDLSGWEVKALTSTGVETTKVTISNGKILSPGQHYLVANTNASGGYSDSTIPDQTYGSGIIDTGGIAIFD
jgi:Lamin Tail Domain